MPRKKKAEPAAGMAVAEPLEQIIASHAVKALVEPDAPRMEMEPPQQEIITSPKRPPIRHVPEGWMNRARHNTAGIGVNIRRDKQVVAIQFDDDKRPSPGEVEKMEIAGITYWPARKQWERMDKENPVANEFGARRIATDMAKARQEGIGR